MLSLSVSYKCNSATNYWCCSKCTYKDNALALPYSYSFFLSVFVTGPAKIGHVGSYNLTTFQTFGSHNFLFQYRTATKFSRFFDNLFGFTTLLTESKYYISILRYVSSKDMVYFSPHALFSQARSLNIIETKEIADAKPSP